MLASLIKCPPNVSRILLVLIFLICALSLVPFLYFWSPRGCAWFIVILRWWRDDIGGTQKKKCLCILHFGSCLQGPVGKINSEATLDEILYCGRIFFALVRVRWWYVVLVEGWVSLYTGSEIVQPAVSIGVTKMCHPQYIKPCFYAHTHIKKKEKKGNHVLPFSGWVIYRQQTTWRFCMSWLKFKCYQIPYSLPFPESVASWRWRNESGPKTIRAGAWAHAYFQGDRHNYEFSRHQKTTY